MHRLRGDVGIGTAKRATKFTPSKNSKSGQILPGYYTLVEATILLADDPEVELNGIILVALAQKEVREAAAGEGSCNLGGVAHRSPHDSEIRTWGGGAAVR